MDGIKSSLLSTKAIDIIDKKKYIFFVQKWLDKATLKDTMEYFFGVKIVKINTLNNKSRKKRFSKAKMPFYKNNYKKVIVTVASHDNIQLFSNI